MAARTVRQAFLVVAAVALLVAATGCGSSGGTDQVVSHPAAAPGTGTAKGANKLTAALQQQVASAGAAAQQLPYSGGAPTRADGRIEVAFHAVGPIGTAEQDALRGLGAEIVQALPTDPLVPNAGVIVAWMAPDKIVAAAAADWVAAVTPPSTPINR